MFEVAAAKYTIQDPRPKWNKFDAWPKWNKFDKFDVTVHGGSTILDPTATATGALAPTQVAPTRVRPQSLEPRGRGLRWGLRRLADLTVPRPSLSAAGRGGRGWARTVARTGCGIPGWRARRRARRRLSKSLEEALEGLENFDRLDRPGRWPDLFGPQIPEVDRRLVRELAAPRVEG